MLTNILVAVITGGLALIGTIYASNKQFDKHYTELANLVAVSNERINQLKEEVHKHNNFAERVPALETKVELLIDRLDKIDK